MVRASICLPNNGLVRVERLITFVEKEEKFLWRPKNAD
jgi:hypothetical protein